MAKGKYNQMLKGINKRLATSDFTRLTELERRQAAWMEDKGERLSDDELRELCGLRGKYGLGRPSNHFSHRRSAMSKVEFVKRANKDYPQDGISCGDSYYKWTQGFRGPLRRSKTRPRPSQTTGNEFLQEIYSIQEEIEDARPTDAADLQDLRDEWVQRVRDAGNECRSKYDKMPEGFQQGDAGQQLEERADAADAWADELEGVNIEELEQEEGQTDEEYAEAVENALADALAELQATDPGV